jgi:alkanesulfonate monooxygenase SsuD/methylene tetrahydromethanopterin reductase-like flavin-dependent oxidoreductase (luciferase family)
MTRPLKIGLVLVLFEDPATGVRVPWSEIRRRALWAEEIGFDTVWVPDELLFKPNAGPDTRGWWEAVAVCGAMAEATSSITVGTWVLSALHRNPALTAKVASTLDEISGGRLLFGFGAGHSGKQGHAFGYPPENIISRYEEALQIVVPLLRGEVVAFEGQYHAAALSNRPPGPRPGGIPILLGGHGPRTIRLAAKFGDIWSAYATASSYPDAFTEMFQTLDRACEDVGRNPKTIGRSIGVEVVPESFTAPETLGVTDPLTGSPNEIAHVIQEFADRGVTSLELLVWPHEPAAIEATAKALELLDA